MPLPPIAATTVGSFPRPRWLARPGPEGRPTELVFQLEGDALREAQDDATRLVLAEQEEDGLDLLSDGEQRRQGFINHVLAALDGFDLEHRRPKAIRGRLRERLVPTVVGKIARRGPIVVDDLRFAKAHTHLPIKMTVPGPVTVIDTTSNQAYAEEAELAMDYAAALNQELRDLQAAGADVLQIDEPAMTRLHAQTAAYGAKALDRCLDGITVPTLVHLCYGYPSDEPRQHQFQYPALLEMLMETRIAGFSLEFARSGYDPAILKLCGDRLIMFGCVDPGNSPAEPVTLLVSRVRQALDYVAPDRLLIAPDCGLMTISRGLARQKVRALVAAAGVVRATL